MLRNTDAIATLAVKDIKVAGKFYRGTLGLEEVPTGEPGVLGYKSGNTSLLVYESQYAGTNKATSATKAAWFKDPDGNILALVNG